MLLVAALAIVAALTAAGPALGAPVGIAVTDRAGDQPNPQLDLRAARVAFDQPTGTLNAAVSLGAPPTYLATNSMSVDLGRSDSQTGSCESRFSASILLPEPGDLELTPVAELYPGGGDEPIGPLPTVVNGATFSFSSAGASPAVLNALRGQRLNCASVHTSAARTFDTADRIAEQPMLSGPKPRCKIGPRSVRGGRSFRFACKGAPRKIGVSIFPQRGRDVFRGTERPRKGRFRVPAIKAIRGGKAYISLFSGDTAFARYLVTIRR